MNKILCIIFLLILCVGCVTFNKTLQNPNPLNSKNVKGINGKYTIVAKNDSLNSYNQSIWIYNNFLSEIDRKVIFNVPKLDSTKTYFFNLEVLNDNKINMIFFENEQIIRNKTLSYKLENDGYLYLKNKNIRPILIPYIAGSIDINKTRLTLDENSNLIFDSTNYRSGAFAIVAFLGGKIWHLRKMIKAKYLYLV